VPLQEYCNGGSLRQATTQGLFEPTVERRWRTLMSLLIDIAQGMAYIHSKRICHGDLNPANVLLKARHPRACVELHWSSFVLLFAVCFGLSFQPFGTVKRVKCFPLVQALGRVAIVAIDWFHPSCSPQRTFYRA
jgi:serine/threonine protein kinase